MAEVLTPLQTGAGGILHFGRFTIWILVAAILWVVLPPTPVLAQRHRWQDEGFLFRRQVELPDGIESSPAVVVADFFIHGVRLTKSAEIAVFANQDRVACKILQRGPDDFCRIAFLVTEKEPRYFVYYGGESKESTEISNWAPSCGLYFEARAWRPCDVSDFAAVRDAFQRSNPLGADLVGEVFHRHNPFAPEPGPFLSRYMGTLRITTPGRYTFFTSSQDCSFLLIDEQPVVSFPGTHPPETQAKVRGEIELSQGMHRFEYHHAAVGQECCMVVAWQMPGFDKPAQMAPELFQYERVMRLTPTSLEHREEGLLPDFRVAVIGDVPLADDQPAVVRTQFMDTTRPLISKSARYKWSFGDGQTSELVNPGHVYLHPGLYPVSLVLEHGAKRLEIVHQVMVTRQYAVDPQGKQGENLSEYLAALDHYNAAHLDAAGLVQLVRTYLLSDLPAPAAAAAQAAFVPSATAHSDESRWALVQLVGPELRGKLDNPDAAAKLWSDASQLISRPEWKAACAVEAADILVNDLLRPADSAKLLATAEPLLGASSPLVRSRYDRVLGDGYARVGKGDEARNAYQRAQAKRELTQSVAEQNAWRGAHSRSCEAFLYGEELARARTELDHWQQDFPGDKISGYWSLLQMRYWIARKKQELAVAVASDALAVNPQSPYADRLLFLSAECDESRGRADRAIATLQSLLADHPGSPLVNLAKSSVQRLTSPRPPTPVAAGEPRGKSPAKGAAATSAGKPKETK